MFRKLRVFLAALVAALSLVAEGQAVAGSIAGQALVRKAGPRNESLPQISGEKAVGGKLTTSAGDWSPTPAEFRYRWLLCNSAGTHCSGLRGATAQTITVPDAAAGRRLRVKVTATGTGGSKTSAISHSTMVIAGPDDSSPPSRPSHPSNPSTPSHPCQCAPKPAPTTPAPTPPIEPPPVEPPPVETPPVTGAPVLFSDDFSYPDGLVTNEYSKWNSSSSSARVSPSWEMTSGSLFAQVGTGWSGLPDGCSTSSPTSVPCTASDVFRLNTREQDFGDVTVSLDLRNNYLTSSSRTPSEAWDGVHVWLHYQSEYNLYYASFNRRDGHVVIKKKCVGGSENGGTYYELGNGELSGYPIPFGTWQHLAASIQDNSDGSVTIAMYRDGAPLLSATDKGLGCAPITAPGGVGVRGDNDDFNFDNFVVTAN